MKVTDSDMKLLQDNLMQIIKTCKILKVGHRNFKTSFTITPHFFLDFIDEKYLDGIHSYRIDSTIKIKNVNGDCIEERCDIHFDALINGTNAELLNGIVIADRDFIPYNFCEDKNL